MQERKYTSRHIWLSLIPMLTLLVPELARARALPKPVLLESHALPQTKQVRRLMRVLVRAIGSRAIAGLRVTRALEQVFGRSSHPLSKSRQAVVLNKLKQADQEMYTGAWRKAVVLLRDVVSQLSRDMVSLSRQPTIFQALARARVQLSNCYLRMNQPKVAWGVMEQVLITQPNVALQPVYYGPLLQRLYLRVKTQLDLQKGSLVVKTNPPGLLVFLNGRSAGFSPVKVDKLYQGTYKIMVVQGRRTSRIKRVTVGPHPARVHFDLQLEQGVRTTGYTGLYLPEGPSRRAQESRLAARVGTRLGADRVLLVGLQKWRGRQAIVGQVFQVKRRVHVAMAYVLIDRQEPSVSTLYRLARFLLHGGVAGGGIVVVRKGPGGKGRAHHSSARDARRRRMTGLAIAGVTLLSAGAASAIGGGVALGVDGRRTTYGAQSPYWYVRWDTAKLGYGLVIGGIGLALGGAALLIWDHLRRRRSNASMRASSGSSRWLCSPVAGGRHGPMLGLDCKF